MESDCGTKLGLSGRTLRLGGWVPIESSGGRGPISGARWPNFGPRLKLPFRDAASDSCFICLWRWVTRKSVEEEQPELEPLGYGCSILPPYYHSILHTRVPRIMLPHHLQVWVSGMMSAVSMLMLWLCLTAISVKLR